MSEARARPGAVAAGAFERAARRLETGAPATAAVTLDGGVALASGDGAVRFFTPDAEPATVATHAGAILSMAAAGSAVITGGDDGRCLRVGPDGATAELAAFGRRWVDHVAAHAEAGLVACASGKRVLVLREGRGEPEALEHPSSVGGLAFDAKGRRLAAAHYGGVTLWEKAARDWRPTRLDWAGSHLGVAFSPDGRFLVTAMQEPALHGWRLRDKADMRMSGYPSKVRAIAWSGDGRWLISSGADSAICWPFEGETGPMGRPPAMVAPSGGRIVTAVCAIGAGGLLAAGDDDGGVRLGEIGAEGRGRALKATGAAPIAALAASADGARLLIADEAGLVLWGALA